MLEPMDPADAVEAYLNDRENELAESSLQNHRYRLDRFLDWCDEVGLENMNKITGRKVQEYKMWRSQDVNAVTLKTQLDTLRVFLRFCERIDAVPKYVPEKVSPPSIKRGEDTRSTFITSEEAEGILEHCEQFEYATLRHVAFYLLWHTGIRSGTARGLDISDYHGDEGFVEVHHRPDTDTPLKNKEEGEREINLKDELCNVLDDFLKMHHGRTEDDFGRMPLLGTDYGRPTQSTLARMAYTRTRPCHYTGECPHDRVIDECEATTNSLASKCPSSVSPHAIRRGAITHHLNAGVPKRVVSDRMNVSPEVLDKHYDERTVRERREYRKSFLGNL